MNAFAHFRVVQCKRMLAKRLPPWGKLARKRLMRGPIGMYLPLEAERPACRSAKSAANLKHFYPVAGEKRQLSKSRSTGLGAGAAGMRSA